MCEWLLISIIIMIINNYGTTIVHVYTDNSITRLMCNTSTVDNGLTAVSLSVKLQCSFLYMHMDIF